MVDERMKSGEDTPVAGSSKERERIEAVYRGYSGSGHRRLWGGPGHAYLLERKWETVRALLRDAGFEGARAPILDLGCSYGGNLARFAALGCSVGSVVCVDIQHHVLSQGRARNPTVPFVEADALRLPFRDEAFDLVHQSVMVSSTLDPDRRRAIAREMVRVTRRGGLIVWYDVCLRNPFNRHVRSIGRRELRSYFQDCTGEIVSLTLIPHIARVVAPLSLRACRLLERVPLLRSHLLAVLRRV